MTWRVFRFELSRQLRLPAFWGLSLLFCGLGFGAMQLLAGAIDSFRIMAMGAESLKFDSPFYLGLIVQSLTFLGLPVTAWLFGSAIHQEQGHRSGPLMWTTRLTRSSLWYGRWGAALTLNMALFLLIALGAWIGTWMPWMEAESFGAGSVAGYLYPYLTSVMPRTLLAGSLAFFLVARLRSMLPGYLAIVCLMALFRVASRLARDLEHRAMAALLDPSGGVAADTVRQYWSVAEKNSRLIPLEGWFLANRLLWTAIALSILVIAGWLLRTDVLPEGRRLFGRLGGWLKARFRGLPGLRPSASLPFWRSIWLRAPSWLKATAMEYGLVIRHPVFLVTVAFGGMSMLAAAGSMDQIYGTTTWPVTYAVGEILSALFRYFSLGLLLFFCGHMVWRERTQRVAPLIDAAPESIWRPLFAKLLALVGIAFTLQIFLVAAGLLYQLYRDYSRHELGLFATELLGRGFVDLLLFVILCLAIQALSPSRWLAYVVTVLFYVGTQSLPAVGLEHVLFRFGSDPGVIYSELNGYGDAGLGWLSLKLVWGGLAALLVMASGLFWPRGEPRPWPERLERATRRFSSKMRLAFAVLGILIFSCGIWTWVNTHHFNEYRSRDAIELARVSTENGYRPWLMRPHPRVVAVTAEVDLYPLRGGAESRVEFQLRNRHPEPIEAFLLRWPDGVEISDLRFDRPVRLEAKDPESGYQIVHFETPLEPGGEVSLEARTQLRRRGFTNQHDGLGVVANGTFIGSESLFPSLGYRADSELRDPRRRRRHGLPDRQPLAPREDPWASTRPVIEHGVEFEVVLSTSANQQALAPGERLESWQRDGRTYSRFRSAAPIPNLFVFVSGTYEVARKRAGEVDLEIYYDADHAYNVETMMRGLEQSLEFYSEAFGPYPHRSLRIVEFPRYQQFAMSLPTLIPFSESIGFIARLDGADSIDYPFYVTAHEVAHQWWPHQVMPARTEGSPFLSESLSQYSALRVMARQYGEQRMGRFLRYELDRYLIGRSASRWPETSLDRLQSGQNHLHYNKGALALWALGDRLGFEKSDAILAAYLSRFAGGEAFPTTADFLDLVYEAAPAADRAWIEDLFERITLYDLSVRRADCQEQEDGTYRVSFEVDIARDYADGEGNLVTAPMDEEIEVGVFGEKRILLKVVPTALHLESVPMQSGSREFTFEVDSKPLRVGVDPYFKRVDRQPFDNFEELRCGALGS